MSGWLSGLRVVDSSVNLPGPYTSWLLASLGAEVIKVEPPKGDPARHIPRLYRLLSRGKKRVVLDLQQDSGRRQLHRLVAAADVFIEGSRPGVAERLGCSVDVLQGLNPRLVYCSISAFGQQGPRRDQPAHDLNLQALSGVCFIDRDPSPRASVLPVADLSSSLAAVGGICAALVARERTGRGDVVDVAMLDSVLSWSSIWDQLDPTRGLPRPVQRLAAKLARRKLYMIPHYGLFRTRTGWIALGAIDEPHFWRGLCRVLHLPLGGMPLATRVALGPAVRAAIAAILRPRSTRHWLALFEAEGLPVTAVKSPRDALSDPHMADRFGGVDAPSPLGRAPTLAMHDVEVSEVLTAWAPRA